LLDDKRAQVVGERSYGDASLRKTIQMDDGGRGDSIGCQYYSPSGKAIQDTGVQPSVQLAENDNTPELDQDGNPIPGAAPKKADDNLLKQSIELVTGKTTIAQLTNDGLPRHRRLFETATTVRRSRSRGHRPTVELRSH